MFNIVMLVLFAVMIFTLLDIIDFAPLLMGLFEYVVIPVAVISVLIKLASDFASGMCP